METWPAFSFSVPPCRVEELTTIREFVYCAGLLDRITERFAETGGQSTLRIFRSRGAQLHAKPGGHLILIVRFCGLCFCFYAFPFVERFSVLVLAGFVSFHPVVTSLAWFGCGVLF